MVCFVGHHCVEEDEQSNTEKHVAVFNW